jgi:Dolichyl-phosphate-mannose-protein mannosyltransferase
LASLAGATAGYILLLVLFRHWHWTETAALLFQYLVLLPLIWAFISRRRDANPRKLVLPSSVTVAIAVCVFFLAVPLARHGSDGLLNPDENGYSFQARIFLKGKLMAAPLPGASWNGKDTPLEVNYENHVLLPRGWFTHFPPGWPLLLASGYTLHAPWLINPLLGIVLLMLSASIGRSFLSHNTGSLTVVLLCACPFFLVNTVRMMSHMLCACLAASACWLLFRALSRRELLPPTGMFGLLALMFHIRPYTAFAVTVVFCGAAIWYSRHERRFLVRLLILAGVSGAITIASILTYNRLYTGHALISPYAAKIGADVPPELTLNPRLIFYFLRRWAPHTFVDTLFGTFPFLFLLAGYALLQEQKYVREIRILAALFGSLVLAYVLHSESSASVYGSRFHFEAFFAIGLMGARGLDLLIERHKLSPQLVLIVLALLLAIQTAHLGVAGEWLWSRGEPYRKVKSAVASLPTSTDLVFLHSSQGSAPDFNPRFLNLNDPDWRHASVVYLIDAEPDRREDWACRFGRSNWVLVGYDAVTGSVWEQVGHALCPAIAQRRGPCQSRASCL